MILVSSSFQSLNPVYLLPAIWQRRASVLYFWIKVWKRERQLHQRASTLEVPLLPWVIVMLKVPLTLFIVRAEEGSSLRLRYHPLSFQWQLSRKSDLLYSVTMPRLTVGIVFFSHIEQLSSPIMVSPADVKDPRVGLMRPQPFLPSFSDIIVFTGKLRTGQVLLCKNSAHTACFIIGLLNACDPH